MGVWSTTCCCSPAWISSPLDFRTVDLLAIAADALHDARVMAPKRTINLTVGTADAPLVTGDEVGRVRWSAT
jgi:hypothetical protein